MGLLSFSFMFSCWPFSLDMPPFDHLHNILYFRGLEQESVSLLPNKVGLLARKPMS